MNARLSALCLMLLMLTGCGLSVDGEATPVSFPTRIAVSTPTGVPASPNATTTNIAPTSVPTAQETPTGIPPTTLNGPTPTLDTPAQNAPLAYLFPSQMPAGYRIVASQSSADAAGFTLVLRVPGAEIEQEKTITIQGGRRVDDQSCKVTIDPDHLGAYFEEMTVRNQPGLYQSSGYGAVIYWCDNGYPYWVNSHEEWQREFIGSLVALDLAPWQQAVTTSGTVTGGAGPWILAVEPGSPAEQAGLRVGQQITAINWEPMTTVEATRAALSRFAQSTIMLELIEDGHQRTVYLPLTSQTLGVDLCESNRFCGLQQLYTPPQVQGFFQSEAGFCYSDGKQVTVLEPSDSVRSFVQSADGTLAAYVLEAKEHATLITYDATTKTRTVRVPLEFTTDGVGDTVGVQVLGITPDKERVIFEERAQVFIARFDGSERREVTPQLNYGASTTHRFSLSPDARRLLHVPSVGPNTASIYDVADGKLTVYQLDPVLSAHEMIDATHVRAVRHDIPYDPSLSNGVLHSRAAIDFPIVDVALLPTQPTP